MFACSGAAVPQPQLTDAKTAVRAAEAVGAKQEVAAELHLKMAENGISDAEEPIAGKQKAEAALVVGRARADAELARTLTETAHHQRPADAGLTPLEDLEQEVKSEGFDR